MHTADPALVPKEAQKFVSRPSSRGPEFTYGYDLTKYYARDVESKGSCAYEAISDQLCNDGGAHWADIKQSLMNALKKLPWQERKEAYVTAVVGEGADIEQYRNDQVV